MIAVLLATSETDKLRPLTEKVPSPMVPIVDRPVMDYVVELLARHGIKRIIVTLHHHANYIEAYFGNGQRWGVSIDYVLQRDPWGTAGALKWAEHLLTEPFLLLPADAFIDVDVNALLAQHRARKGSATIVVHPYKGESNQLLLDDNDRVAAVAEPGHTASQVTNTGVYVLEPSVLEYVPSRMRYDLGQQLVPTLLKANVPLYGFHLQGYWNPLQSFKDHQILQRAYLYGAQENPVLLNTDAAIRYPSVAGRQVASGIWISPNTAIHPSARLAPPVYIGGNCRIGRDVDIGPEAVIGANVIVDDGATIQQSTVMEYTRVGQYVNVIDRFVDKKLLINASTEQYTQVADDFLLGEVQTSLGNNGLQQGFDSLLALIILLLTTPLILAIALILRLVNGRAFVRETCIHARSDSKNHDSESGIGGIEMHRFRTRNPDGTFALFGQILERWELHRLPELWNVARGEFMLVGVKPLEPDTAAEVTEPWQRKRYEYSIGFTGLWYTQTTPDSSLDETLVSDAYYVATRTWRNDLRLLLHTPIVWYKRCAGYKGH